MRTNNSTKNLPNTLERKDLFQNNQVEIAEWFNSVPHLVPSSLERFYYKNGTCPISEFVAEHRVNLPTHPKISESDVKRIVKVLKQFFKGSDIS